MRRYLKGFESGRYPEWATCMDMAKGDPLRAQEIYEKINAEWWFRWHAWKAERKRAGVDNDDLQR